MNLWQRFEKGRSKEKDQGISFHYEKGIDEGLKEKYISFAAWLRKHYAFPVHLNVYIPNCETIVLRNGRRSYGSFRWFAKRPPMIRIPSAIEKELLKEYTLEEIYEQILSSLVHELTHYFQWVSKAEQSDAVSERQANHYRYRILEKYYENK